MFGRRLQLAVLLFLGLLLVCIGKLAHLQLVQHPKFALAALTSLTSEELVPAPRGRILDCNGRVLAEDVPSFDVSVHPGELKLEELTIRSLRKIREIRGSSLDYYAAALKGGYASFGKPEYRPEVRTRYEIIVSKLKPDEEPPDGLLRDLRLLHYRAERGAAIDRLAERDAVVTELAKAAGVSGKEMARGLYAALEHAAKRYGGVPAPAAANISRNAWDKLRIRQHYPLISGAEPLPGVFMTTGVRRRYRYAKTACHVLGYLSPMKEGQYKSLAVNPVGLRIRDYSRDAGGQKAWKWFFRPNHGESNWLRPRGRMTRGKTLSDERVGNYGVEKFYNEHLRGKHAYRTWRLRLRPAGPRGGAPEREPLRSSRPRSGGDVKLTLDLDVQRAAEKALAKSSYRGAAVFLDPNDGSIVAMASHPNFDPAAFVRKRPGERLRLMTHPAKPLLCRAHQGTYPPGSVFKTIVATAALAESAIGSGTTFQCNHVLKVGNRYFECLGTHGTIGLNTGIYKSCNIYFFHTGRELERRMQRKGAPEEVSRPGGLGWWGKSFGLGRRSGVDLTGEAGGLMPDREWKARRYAGRRGMTGWTEGDTCNVAIGQGPVLVTPLQAAVAMAAIANGGKLVRPHVLHSFPPEPPVKWRDHGRLSRLRKGGTTLRLVRKAMYDVVHQPWGTGRLAKLNHVAVAGKTGSAENPHGRTHAWFCGFAPADDPTIAFAVVLENAGHGGAEAAPVAREVLKVLFPGDEPGEEGAG